MPYAASALPRVASYQDVLDAPEGQNAEIIDGELVLSPRPAGPHTNCSTGLGADLRTFFGRRGGGGGRPGGWVILIEPELHLGPQILVPDLAGWRRTRLPDTPDAPYIELVPDWVCEIVSPRSRGRDRMRKMRIYATAGVGHFWLVDPALRGLEVYRQHEGKWLQIEVYEGPIPVRAEPFDAVELEMSEWWLPEAPATESVHQGAPR